MTTNPNDPKLQKIKKDGQQEDYLVLPKEDRERGFVRPLRQTYKHAECGVVTTMGTSIAETFARDPKFYDGTFCTKCGKHFNLMKAGKPAFTWEDGSAVGS